MSRKCLAAVAACCALAIPGALAQQAAPTEAGRAAARAPAPKKSPQWPLVLPEKSPAPAAAPTPQAWSQQDIELAQARCTALLKGLPIVTTPESPLREGSECGTPAPVKLVSMGKSPQVTLSPPPTVTCEMAVMLHRWLERDVQPLARKHLGAPITRIDTMSSYSCRNAYGRAGNRLSEHGKANALDIGAFVTARGQAAMVVADWGPTARQIAAEASARLAAEKAQTADEAPPVVVHRPHTVPTHRPVAAEPLQPRAPATIAIPGVTVLFPAPGSPTGLGLAEPSKLGGPKPADQQAPQAVDPLEKMAFLRGAHHGACKLFNTVLGPEANNAHQNHFHLDLAERVKNTRICE